MYSYILGMNSDLMYTLGHDLMYNSKKRGQERKEIISEDTSCENGATSWKGFKRGKDSEEKTTTKYRMS